MPRLFPGRTPGKSLPEIRPGVVPPAMSRTGPLLQTRTPCPTGDMIHRTLEHPRHEVAYVKRREGVWRILAGFSMLIGLYLVWLS